MALASIAMLAACAGSAARPEPVPAPDPVIERRVEVKPVCPPELLMPLPPEPAMPDDAAVDADAPTLAWIAARFARELLLESRLIDARTACPNG